MLPNKETIARKGFTLMELLVVIAIIGLLSSIIFAITRGADEQGRIAKGLQFGQHLQNSLGSYAVGIWSFDEGSGSTANDISGWGNNGTLVNSPTWRCASVDTSYTPSGQGCSLEFNGVDNYVDIGDETSLDISDAFTVEAWIKANSFLAHAGIVNKGADATANYALAWGATTNKIRLYIGNGTTYQNATEILINLDEWVHLVGVGSTIPTGTNLKLYVNGELKTNNDITINITPSAANLRIGSRSGYNFNGLIDEVRIYATSLTSAQIQSQHYAGLQKLLAKNLISETEHQQRLAKI
jgi:prepilin-type N-terminal cleavage/methylation domain-containing protein